MPAPTAQVQSAGETLSEIDGANVLRVAPNAPFWLVHWRNAPGSWEPAEIDGQSYWLPVLSPFILTVGVNGFRTAASGEDPSSRVSRSKVVLTDRGGELLDVSLPVPAEFVPPGQAVGPGFLRSAPCRGGKFYHIVWDVPRQPLAGREMTPEHYRDLFNRWRRWLVEEGHIAPPDPQVLEDAISNASRRVHDVASASMTDESSVREQRRAKPARREALHLAAVVPGADPAPAPPSRPRGKKAAEVAA